MELRDTFRYRDKEHTIEEAEALLIELETAAIAMEIDRQSMGQQKQIMMPEVFQQWRSRFMVSWILTHKTVKRLRLWLNQQNQRQQAANRDRRMATRVRTDEVSLNAEEQTLVHVYGVLRHCYMGGEFTDAHVWIMDALRDLLRAKGIDAQSVMFNGYQQGHSYY